MASLTIVLVIIIGVVGAVLAVNYFEERAKEKTDILGPLHDDRLCKSHTWSKLALLTTEQFTKVNQLGEDLDKQTFRYCASCGFVPDLHRMVRPTALGKLAAQELIAKQRKQDQKDLEELKEEYFRTVTKDWAKHTNLVDVRTGYDLYDAFVEVVPQLLADKRLKRLMNELNQPEKKVD